MSTDLRAVVRDRILALGLRPHDVGVCVARAWGCTEKSAATTIGENFLGGNARLQMDSLPPLLTALGLRIEPGPKRLRDLRAVVRRRVPRDEYGRYQWGEVADRVAPAWGLTRQRAVETLSKAFGDNPSRGIYLDKVGPLLDALGCRVVEATAPDEA